MFKVKKHQNDVTDISLWTYVPLFSSVSIADFDFEQVNVRGIKLLN